MPYGIYILETEDGMTSTEQQLLDSVRNDVNQHRDIILERGYTLDLLMSHMEELLAILLQWHGTTVRISLTKFQ